MAMIGKKKKKKRFHSYSDEGRKVSQPFWDLLGAHEWRECVMVLVYHDTMTSGHHHKDIGVVVYKQKL